MMLNEFLFGSLLWPGRYSERLTYYFVLVQENCEDLEVLRVGLV